MTMMARTLEWIRGRVLQTLADNEALASPMSFVLLLRTLDTIGVSVSARELRGELEYLTAKGYAELRRRADMPGWARERMSAGRPTDVIAVKLLPRGLDLVQRNIAADPGVELE